MFDDYFSHTIELMIQRDDRSGPCEDDYEAKCPYVDMLPEESGKEDGSPLKFRSS
jgi:hypothetical protein